jgi:general secretion pathway protein C
MIPERRDELALRVVSVVVVGSLAVALAGLTWRLTGWDDGRSEVAVAGTLPPLSPAVGGDADVARILGLAPFGGGAAPGGLPGSSSGLVLKGVLMAYPPAASTALIALGDGPAALYGVGQAVADGVIESIAVDHVILVVGGARQRLDFPAPVAGATPDPSVPGAGITVTTPGAPPASPEVAAAAQAAAPSPPPVDRGATANVATAAGTLGVAATTEGYRVGDNPSAELRRFGLQPGDIIETLNGQAVGNAATDQQLFERARSAGQARVVVVRQGRRVTLNFSLR